ncbi:hypothetical protein [Cohnella rhizosphaerae]|uniref:Uncharacterized protein n=1 Tax=Cohnella rhizosphaerae TaxID=1457232 RepID=A0A9X4QXL1_9BACL|nr:hypothetical protein [Cohnella rhizosphaerae]MDG0813612.1 hypothetical protein [Cohnella rhizosphaerae]
MHTSRYNERRSLLGVLATGILIFSAACGSSHSVQPEASTASSSAEVSRASPTPSPEVSIHALGDDAAGTPETAYSHAPRIGGISLGMTLADAEAEIGGPPSDSYSLPDAGRTVELREYGGLTVGVDTSGHVVYVEISSAAIASGLPNVEVGSSISDAARRLSLKAVPSSSSMTADVEGGILRLDLDPVSDEVLTIKLIGSALV